MMQPLQDDAKCSEIEKAIDKHFRGSINLIWALDWSSKQTVTSLAFPSPSSCLTSLRCDASLPWFVVAGAVKALSGLEAGEWEIGCSWSPSSQRRQYFTGIAFRQTHHDAYALKKLLLPYILPTRRVPSGRAQRCHTSTGCSTGTFW
jgi:hypothetical protein